MWGERKEWANNVSEVSNISDFKMRTQLVKIRNVGERTGLVTQISLILEMSDLRS